MAPRAQLRLLVLLPACLALLALGGGVGGAGAGFPGECTAAPPGVGEAPLPPPIEECLAGGTGAGAGAGVSAGGAGASGYQDLMDNRASSTRGLLRSDGALGSWDAKDASFSLSATAKRSAVVEAIRWSWGGYKASAWGEDELLPVTRGSNEWFGLGLTLVDALDTLLLAGLDKEFREAREWVARELDVTRDVDVNLFETTIRVLGGLLSAYHLSGGGQENEVFKQKAEVLGRRLNAAFDTPTGIPYSDVNLRTGHAHGPDWANRKFGKVNMDSSLAEVGTLQLEFSYLAELANDPEVANPANKVMGVIDKMKGKMGGGLCPVMLKPTDATFTGSAITLGGRGDSYYEYLLKQWLASAKTDTRALRMYQGSMRAVRQHLVARSSPGGLTYIREMHSGKPKDKMDHLVCFLPGLLALGAHEGAVLGIEAKEHLALAEELMLTCYEMYRRTPTGLAAEIYHFYPDRRGTKGEMSIATADEHNLLRPETVESLFVLHRITGNVKYRHWGWAIFQAFEKHSKVKTGGYTSLKSVMLLPPPPRDKMESFWLSETLKYLFLLFHDDPDVLPLHKYVFNTEAHPIPIKGTGGRAKAIPVKRITW